MEEIETEMKQSSSAWMGLNGCIHSMHRNAHKEIEGDYTKVETIIYMKQYYSFTI